MGCVRSKPDFEDTKTRCGKCLVGKLSIQLKSLDLHSLKMNLERIEDLKLHF